MGKMKNLFFHPESWELEVIDSLWSVLSVGPGHIKLLQPRPEVASNLKDPDRKILPHAPTTRAGIGSQPKWLLCYLYDSDQARALGS